jgi:hypothetical protein
MAPTGHRPQRLKGVNTSQCAVLFFSSPRLQGGPMAVRQVRMALDLVYSRVPTLRQHFRLLGRVGREKLPYVAAFQPDHQLLIYIERPVMAVKSVFVPGGDSTTSMYRVTGDDGD